jgi:hypothetical protein
MVAGADSIDDMDLLRHGGMDRLFSGVRAQGPGKVVFQQVRSRLMGRCGSLA